MIIQTFPSGPFETNAYVVACPETRKAAIIDPAPHSTDTIVNFMAKEDLKLQMILITHSHWDHIGDTAELKAKFHVPVFVHALDATNLTKPGSDGIPYWGKIEGTSPNQFLDEGDTMTLETLEFRVIHTPGHSPGSICFYFEKQGVLFTGDTLFKGSIGNLSLPTSDPEKMWHSLEKLAKLPPETTIYPGHGPSTTIGDEPWLERAQEIFGY